MPKDILKLILSLGLCLGTGIAGSIFTVSAIPTWYQSLNKPVFSPPNWIFAPVWTVLYIIMGVSLYLVLSNKGKNKYAIGIFTVQLILNILWSILFFGLQNPGLALAEILVLWAAIFLTIKSFYPISKTAAYLLLPYLLWVSFASILNLMIVLLN